MPTSKESTASDSSQLDHPELDARLVRQTSDAESGAPALLRRRRRLRWLGDADDAAGDAAAGVARRLAEVVGFFVEDEGSASDAVFTLGQS